MLSPCREYYSALKRNGILTHAATRLNPENRWSEKSQTQKATQHVVSFRGNVQERHIQRQKDERLPTCGGGWEEGKQDVTLTGLVFFRGMEMSWQ